VNDVSHVSGSVVAVATGTAATEGGQEVNTLLVTCRMNGTGSLLIFDWHLDSSDSESASLFFKAHARHLSDQAETELDAMLEPYAGDGTDE
jgi:hypothetical protein